MLLQESTDQRGILEAVEAGLIIAQLGCLMENLKSAAEPHWPSEAKNHPLKLLRGSPCRPQERAGNQKSWSANQQAFNCTDLP